MLNAVAEREQKQRWSGQLGAKLVIQLGKLRHHHGNKKGEQADHHHDQDARIDEAGSELLAEGEGYALEIKIALQNFFEIAGALAGQQRGGVDQRKISLHFKRFRDRLTGFDARSHIFKLPTEALILLPLGQQVERAEDGQAGFNQSQKLLVKDEERSQLDLLLGTTAEHGRLGLDRVDQVAGLGEARAQLLRSSGRMNLLQDATAFVSEFYGEFSHARCLLEFRRSIPHLAKPYAAWLKPNPTTLPFSIFTWTSTVHVVPDVLKSPVAFGPPALSLDHFTPQPSVTSSSSALTASSRVIDVPAGRTASWAAASEDGYKYTVSVAPPTNVTVVWSSVLSNFFSTQLDHPPSLLFMSGYSVDVSTNAASSPCVLPVHASSFGVAGGVATGAG